MLQTSLATAYAQNQSSKKSHLARPFRLINGCRRKSRTLAQASTILLAMIVLPDRAHAMNYTYIDQIRYTNCGGYDVSAFWVHWKEDDKEKKQSFYQNTANRDATCFNLNSIGIPEGSEVWLSYMISGGEKEGCRKDKTKFYYRADSNQNTHYTSKGTILNKNRCRLGHGNCTGRLNCSYRLIGPLVN